ncbi:hypothetical protein H5410_045201 [Solanum commersonii]|uniref:Uncharacterized protein n=1 Tax=Solanum commersonii TaxID=4109 RepID=A0A9J5XAV9_SOLCO|nr:hypothetical protein H5410_045201 [Solanum commersonii]
MHLLSQLEALTWIGFEGSKWTLVMNQKSWCSLVLSSSEIHLEEKSEYYQEATRYLTSPNSLKLVPERFFQEMFLANYKRRVSR